MTRIRTTGNAKPHIVHHGYRHTSAHSSRWADAVKRRPATEPHPLLGGALLIGLFVVGVLLIVGFSKYSGV